ncbi:MAG: ribbon-helix-helix protein, CopG family [Candidatus Omnitrophica bacterium]|nr:ribbon-helix-helix protein, CopG family [Candidatus Omnitrophota bacterium]
MAKVKLIGVKMPVDLARTLEQVAGNENKTVSVLVREIVSEYLESEISLAAWETIEKGRQEYREGRCIPWREALNG